MRGGAPRGFSRRWATVKNLGELQALVYRLVVGPEAARVRRERGPLCANLGRIIRNEQPPS
jgi:hypothetical protein